MRETIRARADLSNGRVTVVSRPDRVRLDTQANDAHAVALLCPDEARELAAALLRAADEAEGVERPSDGSAERNLLDFISRVGWDGTNMVSAVVKETRDKVAAELEQMDGTNMGMNISRTQAMTVARNGLRPMDTRHGTTQRMWLS